MSLNKAVDRIAEIETEDVTPEQGKLIKQILEEELEAGEWTVLDEQSGRFVRAKEWHWKLRQARNRGYLFEEEV